MPPRKKRVVEVETEDVSMDPVGDIYVSIKKCLEPKATMADVGRLYKLKDQLDVIDWAQPESLELKSLLLLCFESKVFYKSAPGLNFLAIVFNLHPLLLPLINEVLKRSVLQFSHQQVLSCGQVLFKAWQLSTGGMRLLLEQFVTEWMRRALFTSTKTAERVRFLLAEFHGTRRTSEIDFLLSRYYGPILFRHTKVANWEVRFNAVALLCSAFPVMPPDRSAIEFEEKLTVQFRILKEAMEDPNESVRKVAVVGTGRILRDFWEVLTIEQIAMVVDTLTEKCGRDKKSVKTRLATINAVSLVMDNPLSHGVMGLEILTNFCRSLFNDESSLVRLGMAQFLEKISRIKGIKFADIVPQTLIFARLVADHTLSLRGDSTSEKIAQILAAIVAPSLFSSSVEDQAIKCDRMAQLLPAGLLALTANLGSVIPELDRIRLAVALFARKTPILMRASADLFRSAKWAGKQGTEDSLDAESLKLCAFVYKHIVDREVAQLELTPELVDVLTCLDGCRLPTTFCRIDKFRLQPGCFLDLTRIASVWGMYGQTQWSKNKDGIAAMLGVALKLGDIVTMEKNLNEIIKFLQSSQISELTQLGLACLLRLAVSNQDEFLGPLTSVIHRVNIGLFGSLTSPALPVCSMTEFIHFYLLFLVATNLLCGVPLSACKFEDLVKIYWKWVDRENANDPRQITDACQVVAECIASQQGASLCLSVAEHLFTRVTDAATLEKLVKEITKEFVFTNEFNTMVTKLNLEKNQHVLTALAKVLPTGA